MNAIKFLLYGIFIILMCSGLSNAQEYDMQEAMRLATPNEHHKQLENDFAGGWTYNASMAWEGQVMTSGGTSSNKMILGGRFIMFEAEGEMWGQQVKSITIMGYDNAKEKYTMIGLDELGTYYITAEGDYDEATGTYSLSGTYEEPVLKKMQNYRFTMDVSNPGIVDMRIFFDDDKGGEFEMMSLQYNKK